MKRTSVLLILLIPAFLLIFLTSCEKEEGKGGTSSITGRVVVHQYNSNFTTLIEQYNATDEDVFIIYGDDIVYGDKTSTNYDGTFRFDYLREGSYTIFAYSEDSAGYPSQREIPIMESVTISDKNQEIKLPVIKILK